jgi:membrane protease YdiL (CAAX protease family)
MSRPLSLAWAFGWTFGVVLVLLAGLELTEALRPGARTDIMNLAVWEALVYGGASFGILWFHLADHDAREGFGLRVTHPGLLALGLLLGLSAQGPAQALESLVQHFFPPSEQALAERAALLWVDGPLRAVLLVLGAACIVPLAEELFFRGALYGALRRSYGAFWAATVSSLCFVLSHLSMTSWPALLFMAALLAHLRVVSGSLLPCIALHVGFNAVAVASVFWGTASRAEPLQVPPLVVAGSLLMTGLIVFVADRVGRMSALSRRARAKDAE